MTLIIRSLNPPPQARLRQLIMESLSELFGANCRALPALQRLPADSLAVVDAAQRLWAVSYTNSNTNAGRALLNGLAALQELRTLLPWMRQTRLIGQNAEECRLLILAPVLPMGVDELLRLGPIDWRRMRFLEVNGEPGIWFEPAQLRPRPATTDKFHSEPQAEPQPPAAAAPTEPAQAPSEPGRLKTLKSDKSGLSPEEEEFFQHL